MFLLLAMLQCLVDATYVFGDSFLVTFDILLSLTSLKLLEALQVLAVVCNWSVCNVIRKVVLNKYYISRQ